MSDEHKDTVTCRIEGTAEPAATARQEARAEAAGGSHGEAGPATQPNAQSAQGTPEPVYRAVSRWLSTAFPRYRGAVAGGLVGLVVAIMLFTVGVWRTLVVVALVTLGVAAGQYFDGDPKIVRVIQRLLKR